MMQGRVLELDGMGAGGTILGSDGSRYAFVIGEWRAADKPTAGGPVDFILGDNSTAREIFPLPPSAAYVPPPPGAAPWAAQGGQPQPAASVAYVPPQQVQAAGGSSVLLGILGIICLLLSFVVPFVATIAAFILGLIGADSGKRYKNTLGLVLSRISWIGALVLFILGILFIGFFVSIMAVMFGISPDDIGNWSLV
jgi:hypothetical protein